MVYKNNDFILIEYTTSVKLDDKNREVFDTTSKEIAREHNIFREDKIYEPKLVIIGGSYILKAVNKQLADFEINRKDVIEVLPKDAFGRRDHSKFTTISLRKLAKQNIHPKLGAIISLGIRRKAVVRSITAGRVLLDFNHPYAGKTLIYDLKVIKQCRTTIEKIMALVHHRLPLVNVKQFKIDLGKDNLKIYPPEEIYYLEGIQLAKRGLASDIKRYISKLDKIIFIEEFK